MKENLERAIGFIIKQECNPGEEMTGSYHSDPGDPGGETKFGISKRANPDLDIKNLTREQAIARYKERYAVAVGFDKLPSGIDLMVLDFGVNAGTGRANVLLGRVTDLIGADRLEDPDDKELILSTYKSLRRAYYMDLVKSRPKSQKFLKGWLVRTDRVYQEALQIMGVTRA